MPQHQLIKTEASCTGVTIHILEPVGANETGYEVRVSKTWSTGVTGTVFLKRYEGVALDLLTDLAMEVACAYLYGERSAIEKACQSNWRKAREHVKRHEESGHPF